MSHQKRDDSETVNCAAKACAELGCETECCPRADASPFGIILIPGSGKLLDFPASDNGLNRCCSPPIDIPDCAIQNGFCPKAFPPTEIVVTTCSDIASLSNINFINGDLIIIGPETCNLVPPACVQLPTPSSDAIDIFNNLLGINGSLYIVGTTYQRITGFEKLRWVTGSIVIVNNPSLYVIPTFPSLLDVGGQIINIPPYSSTIPCSLSPGVPQTARCGRSAIIIANNAVLRKVTGFEAVRQVNDGIFISDNPCLTHICGFIHLYRTARIVINGNSKLTKLVGFCYTDTINVALLIFNNNNEGTYDFTISAFASLETAGEIVITSNKGLKAIKFESLRTVAAEFNVNANPQLEEIISSVHYVGNLGIQNNKSLTVIKLNELKEINANLTIAGNCSLLCLDNFEELRSVGGAIIIADNSQLVELRGFNKLKYIGARCVVLPSIPAPSPCQGCGCTVSLDYDWTSIIVDTVTCTVIDNFHAGFFDIVDNSCGYVLPYEFFFLVCNANPACGTIPSNIEIPCALSASLVIFRNNKLRAIGGFCNLKHVKSSIFIVANAVLHTINAFGQLAFALDIFIRNNSSLKYIIGFNNLLSVRDLVVAESLCLIEFNGLKSLEFAQDIAIEGRTAKTVKLPHHPIPSAPSARTTLVP